MFKTIKQKFIEIITESVVDNLKNDKEFLKNIENKLDYTNLEYELNYDMIEDKLDYDLISENIDKEDICDVLQEKIIIKFND